MQDSNQGKRRPQRSIVVALAGNPNSGKTTIFNNLTGANQHVANFPGVTVEKKEGRLSHNGFRFTFIDLPGAYSLAAHSPDEVIVRDFILKDRPDIVVDIVDATSLERGLYLTTQLAELDVPIVLALNMSDLAQRRGIRINHGQLADLLGMKVVPTVGNKRKGMAELLEALVATIENGDGNKPVQIKFDPEFREEIDALCRSIQSAPNLSNGYPHGWLAARLLENDQEIRRYFSRQSDAAESLAQAEQSRSRIETLFGKTATDYMTGRRYDFIGEVCAATTTVPPERKRDLSDKLDSVLLHPIFGLPIFALLMWLMFHLTFTLGEKPTVWIEWSFARLADLAYTYVPGTLVKSLVADGIIGGVGGVLVFLPNIMILFLAIAVIEDTGYIARAAFVMDRIMHKIGLHGKSFIPLLIGFGCSVPAYMGSRIIENRTDRLVTMHVTSFMSCSARLPVYVLIGGAFWAGNAGTVIFSIYALGIVVAVASVKVLRVTRFRARPSPLVIELPPYRMPTFRSLLLHTWSRSYMYVRKAGTIILGFAILMWFLMTFPQKKEFTRDYDSLIKATSASSDSRTIKPHQSDSLVFRYSALKNAEALEYTFAGRLGKAIEPLIKPLGFDWRLGIALVSGFAAKEVVVSTMGTVYGVGDNEHGTESLRSSLASDPKYSRLSAYAFLVFVLLYVPCMSAMAVFLRETSSWKEVLFQMSYTTALAWVTAFVAYQAGKMIGLG